MPHKASRPPLRSRILEILLRTLLPFFGVALLAGGLVGVVTFAFLPLTDSLLSRNWEPIQARVESVGVRAPSVAIPLALDLVEVNYRYDFEGQSYVGQRFGPHGLLESHKASLAFVASVQADPLITIWIDPDRPESAMVHRDLNWNVVALSLPALVFCFLGALMVMTGMVIWNDRRSVLRRRKAR